MNFKISVFTLCILVNCLVLLAIACGVIDRLCKACPIGKNILDVSSRGSKVKKLMQGSAQVSLIVFYLILATNKKQKRNSMTPKGKQHLVNSKVVWVKMTKILLKKVVNLVLFAARTVSC